MESQICLFSSPLWWWSEERLWLIFFARYTTIYTSPIRLHKYANCTGSSLFVWAFDKLSMVVGLQNGTSLPSEKGSTLKSWDSCLSE